MPRPPPQCRPPPRGPLLTNLFFPFSPPSPGKRQYGDITPDQNTATAKIPSTFSAAKRTKTAEPTDNAGSGGFDESIPPDFYGEPERPFALTNSNVASFYAACDAIGTGGRWRVLGLAVNRMTSRDIKNRASRIPEVLQKFECWIRDRPEFPPGKSFKVHIQEHMTDTKAPAWDRALDAIEQYGKELLRNEHLIPTGNERWMPARPRRAPNETIEILDDDTTARPRKPATAHTNTGWAATFPSAPIAKKPRGEATSETRATDNNNHNADEDNDDNNNNNNNNSNDDIEDDDDDEDASAGHDEAPGAPATTGSSVRRVSPEVSRKSPAPDPTPATSKPRRAATNRPQAQPAPAEPTPTESAPLSHIFRATTREALAEYIAAETALCEMHDDAIEANDILQICEQNSVLWAVITLPVLDIDKWPVLVTVGPLDDDANGLNIGCSIGVECAISTGRDGVSTRSSGSTETTVHYTVAIPSEYAICDQRERFYHDKTRENFYYALQLQLARHYIKPTRTLACKSYPISEGPAGRRNGASEN